ncbi:hypothetical protein DEO72_LG3g1510 [Vigna unguiculata]|uniref:Uncharacterized protein n=1 Tax=Vigna unguiculata TaxID=3917 RepID=A0A4D6LEE3_VIGUN|nr:hypothetical protein DEO72_LG3g1510 [Vigna unguiculata]
MIENDDDVKFVIGYAKKYEPHVQFEVMAFIREYIETSSDVIWEHMEKQLNDSLNIEVAWKRRRTLLKHGATVVGHGDGGQWRLEEKKKQWRRKREDQRRHEREDEV